MKIRPEDLRGPLESLGLRSDGARLSLHSTSLFPLYLLETRDQRLALKGVQSLNMGRAEAEGLQILEKFGARVPRVRGVLEAAGSSWLLMDFIDAHISDRGAGRQDLIASLARLYSHRLDHWGGSSPNFIGTLSQPNHRHADFESFWWSDRIAAMLLPAQSAGHLRDVDPDRLRPALGQVLADLPASADGPRPVHGDLWSGNVLFSHSQAWLIDPSVAWSCPEQDFAMLELFGSPLGPADYRSIATEAGFHPGGQRSMDFFQLYPLLVHVRIFGGGYETQTRSLIRRLVGF